MSYAVTYRLRLVEPVLAAEETGDSNSAVSAPYLPGGALRGALIRRRGTPSQDAAANPDFRRRFLDGSVQFLHGYPVCEGVRSLPVPLSWLSPKNDADSITDFIGRTIHPDDGDQSWQGIRGAFWARRKNAQGVVVISPKRNIDVHNARSRRYGRARQDDGAVFRYDSLAKEQTFEAVVVCTQEADALLMQQLLKQKPDIWLGGSGTGGYGRTVITEISSIETKWREVSQHPLSTSTEDNDSDEEWQETSVEEEAVSDDEAADISDGAWSSAQDTDASSNSVLDQDSNHAPVVFTVTLLSDALLRDAFGQPAVSKEVLARTIEQILSWPADCIQIKDCFLAGHIVGGFNQKWGLALPQHQATQMGSVFVLSASALSEAERMLLETTGLGERRAEGFGRIAIDWLPQTNIRRVDASNSSDAFTGTLTDNDAEDTAIIIAERLFLRRLESTVGAKANDVVIVNPPPNAQIGTLRAHLREELCNPLSNPETRLDYISRTASPTAAAQYRKAQVSGISLEKWLTQWLTKEPSDQAWQELGIEAEDLRAVAGRKPDRDARWPHAVLKYCDAVLAKAAKQARRAEES